MVNELTVTEGNGGLPEEPDWSNLYGNSEKGRGAAKYWRGIVHEMKEAGTISPENGHSIFRVVTLRLEFDEASLDVALHGRTGSGRTKAGNKVTNPNWGMMFKAAEMLKELEAELGLSPRRRSSATKVTRGKKKDTAASTYLRSVG